MSNAAKSVLVFGIYLVVVGLVFLVVPNLGLTLFGLPPTTEPWIRVVGLIVVRVGYLYVQAGRHELMSFFRATLIERAIYIVVVIVLIVTGILQPILILFPVIDLLGAIWTGMALRASANGS
jgi:hypothetical protein